MPLLIPVPFTETKISNRNENEHSCNVYGLGANTELIPTSVDLSVVEKSQISSVARNLSTDIQNHGVSCQRIAHRQGHVHASSEF